MNEPLTPTQYEIRVRGLLSETLLGGFAELDTRTLGRDTVLFGPLPDQSALHGVLARIEAFGLELIEVRRVDDAGQADAPAY